MIPLGEDRHGAAFGGAAARTGRQITTVVGFALVLFGLWVVYLGATDIGVYGTEYEVTLGLLSLEYTPGMLGSDVGVQVQVLLTGAVAFVAGFCTVFEATKPSFPR